MSGLAAAAMDTMAMAIAKLHVDHLRNEIRGAFIDISGVHWPLWANQRIDDATNLGKT